jgi:hypothetical protein
MRMLMCSLWYAPARAFGGTVTVAVATVKGALAAGLPPLSDSKAAERIVDVLAGAGSFVRSRL